jgi:hypothetical protein
VQPPQATVAKAAAPACKSGGLAEEVAAFVVGQDKKRQRVETFASR